MDILDKLANKIFKIFLKIYVFFLGYFRLLKRKWKLRKAIKTIKDYGGEVKISSNEYIGGVNTEITLPLDDEEISPEIFEAIEKLKKNIK